ncbi:MAG: hypothetical protein CM15mP68_3590 [Pseudomonadota bacterium]|nr:MAG: hypothetical protein CM15mP68_3590 [Pseudomonadota bacterium]
MVCLPLGRSVLSWSVGLYGRFYAVSSRCSLATLASFLALLPTLCLRKDLVSERAPVLIWGVVRSFGAGIARDAVLQSQFGAADS